MGYDPEKHHRQSIRLKGYDYSQPGAYYMTICTEGRACVLGEVVDGRMVLSAAGEIVQADWDGLPEHYPHVRLDAFQIMPNHVHGIIVLVEDREVGAGPGGREMSGKHIDVQSRRPAPVGEEVRRHPTSEIIRSFKAYTTIRINKRRWTPGEKVWQRNYYERIVRDEEELNAIRTYIACNPGTWDEDEENPRFYP
jgi:REP element-mobilizing transposase RayT